MCSSTSFGDTVNTAARMESTGERGRIQLSQSTADLLVFAGKERWFVPRDGTVTAKGKGALQTFWLELVAPNKASTSNGPEKINSSPQIGLGDNDGSGAQNALLRAKNTRSIDWLSEVLLDYVKQIVSETCCESNNLYGLPDIVMLL